MADRKDTNRSSRAAPDDMPRVAALHDLDDFQVAEGFPDPRGWDVLAADGNKVGSVHDLIVDTGEMRTRYLDIKLDRAVLGRSEERYVLLPVGAARLDDDDDDVILDALTAQQLVTLPGFSHGEITRDFENSVLARMPGWSAAGTTGAAAAADFYSNKHFDDARFFGNRGRAGRTATEQRSATSGGNVAGNENEVRIPITGEEVTVQKRPVVKEEVIVTKRAVSEQKGTADRNRVDPNRPTRDRGTDPGESRM